MLMSSKKRTFCATLCDTGPEERPVFSDYQKQASDA